MGWIIFIASLIVGAYLAAKNDRGGSGSDRGWGPDGDDLGGGDY